jgi:hypothetical protein
MLVDLGVSRVRKVQGQSKDIPYNTGRPRPMPYQYRRGTLSKVVLGEGH